MSYADDHIEQFMAEEAMWRDTVHSYIERVTLHELLDAARRTMLRVRVDHPDYDEEEVEKARSIMLKGIGYQKLSDRQRYVLGDFILTYQ